MPTAAGTSSAQAAPAITAVQAYDAVRSYLELASQGDLADAYDLWAPAWRAQHPYPAWAAAAPVPAGASYEVGASVAAGGGEWSVPFRIGIGTAAGVRWADGTYTVAGADGGARLEAGGPAPPAPTLDLQALGVPAGGAGGVSGDADCAGYSVAWSATPGPGPAAGWTSHLSITAPDGKPVPAPALAPFSFGSTPTACGDFFGDGGEEIVITSATTTSGAYRQAFVYRLAGTSPPVLLGQISSVGDPADPRPVSPDGLYPYLMVASAEIDTVAGAPILAPVYWAYDGVLYRNATSELPGILRADLQANLAALAGGAAACHPLPSCAAPDLLGAYYDQEELGEKGSGLPALQALLPAGDRSWLAGQAAIVDYVVRSP